MSGPLVHRLRLPAAVTSPATARHAVAAFLSDVGLDHRRDEALLLTSELVNNGVIHARSEVELEMVADPDGIQVTVTDFATNGCEFAAAEVEPSGGDAAVGGWGLKLVAQFASRWGTTHGPGARAVWFRLDDTLELSAAEAGSLPPEAGANDSEDALSNDSASVRLSDIDAVIDAVLRPSRREPNQREPSDAAALSETLDRLATGLAADTATVTVDRADGRGAIVFARHVSRHRSAPGGRTVRLPLRLSRPWTGELSLTGAQGPHAKSVAALMVGQLSLFIENQRLEQAHQDRRGWLLYLAEAGELLAHSTSFELTTALLPRLIVPRLGQWCAVHVANEYGELIPMAFAHVNESAIAELTADLERARSALTQALEAAGPTRLSPTRDGTVFPLTSRGEHLGTVTVGRPPNRAHTAEELAILSDLSRRAAVAIDNARARDNRSRIATVLQQSLLPPKLPSINGLEVAAQYAPAGDGLDVGGDFYDVIPLPGLGWLLAVGDVSGKGVGAAAVTGLVREVLHTLALDYRDPVHTLSRLNAALVKRGGGYFCTLVLALLTAAGSGTFDVSLHLAGHDQPVLLRADGTASFIGKGGTALGLLDRVRTPRTRVRLGRGDTLVFYTDGVTERRRGRTLYGEARLLNAISALAGSPAAVLASELRNSVLAFSPTPPRDDIAIVAIRVP